MKEISLRMGYISTSQFSDLYKRYFGVSPTLFRRMFELEAQKSPNEFNLNEY
ncbi:AraC family transcriptional regulator [Paenibacillus sp. P3E]|uniref:AraC family transcriptional regulator n=1 Tax=Paenibacillus sp. P3E TaxID=1349435 RepID=UPI003532123B